MKSKQLDRFIGIRVTDELFNEFSTCVKDINTTLRAKNLHADVTVSDQLRALMMSFVEHQKSLRKKE